MDTGDQSGTRGATVPAARHLPSLFHQRFEAVSGVVNDDVDAAPDGQRLIYGLLNVLRSVAHVKNDDA